LEPEVEKDICKKILREALSGPTINHNPDGAFDKERSINRDE